jgi:hypothetical protein
MSDAARIERLRDWFDVQLQFAEVVTTQAGLQLDVSLTFYTNLHRRFGLGRPDPTERSPEWDRFLRDVVAIPSRADRLACTMTFAHGRLKGWPEPSAPFGCFSFDPPKEGAIRIHFSPNDTRDGVGPLSRAKVDQRVAELREMFARIREQHPDAERVVGGSWLYHLEAYRRLFPAAYVSSLRIHTTPSNFTGGSWWGQFVDHDGNVVPERVRSFTENLANLDPAAVWRAFPLPALAAQASVDVFHHHFARGA